MRYRKSCGPVLEAPPDASHVVGAGWATSWWPKSTESCTGGKSADSVCDGSGNAATTIDSGLSEAAVVSVAVPAAGSAGGRPSGGGAAVVSVAAPAAGSAAVATSALATATFATTVSATTVLATTALPIAIACGSSASLAVAAGEAARSSMGTARAFSVPAEPKPASKPTIHPARTTVPQNVGATIVNRRGFMMPSPP